MKMHLLSAFFFFFFACLLIPKLSQEECWRDTAGEVFVPKLQGTWQAPTFPAPRVTVTATPSATSASHTPALLPQPRCSSVSRDIFPYKQPPKHYEGQVSSKFYHYNCTATFSLSSESLLATAFLQAESQREHVLGVSNRIFDSGVLLYCPHRS